MSARADAALDGVTPGPWVNGNRYTESSVYSEDGDTLVANTHGSQRNFDRESQIAEQNANRDFITASRQLVPDLRDALISERAIVAALEAENARLWEFYNAVEAVGEPVYSHHQIERVNKARAANATLTAERASLAALLSEAAQDLTAYVDAEYPADSRKAWPDIERKHNRDMSLVRQIRAAIATDASAEWGE